MFESLGSIFLLVGIILAALAIIAVSLLFGLSYYFNKKYDTQIRDASFSVRVYTIDLENETVTFFNRSNLKKRTTFSIIKFYEHFPVDEREDLIGWINDLIDDEADVQRYKEIHVLAKHRKSNFFSFLEVKDVDYKKKVIRIDSYLLKPSNVRKARKDELLNFSTQEAFNNQLSNFASTKGFTVAFDFYNLRNNDEISHLAFVQIKNVFKNYILTTRPIIELASHQIIVSDLKATNRLQFVQLINSIKNEVNSLLMLQSLQDQIGFTMAAIENKYMMREPEKLVNTLLSLTQIARDDKEPILWYEEGRNLDSEHGDETYRTEVERIIRDKKLKYTYRPIVDLEKCKVVGYQSFVEPLDSFFGSIKELKNYASRTEDDRILFATIARNIIARFAQENSVSTHRLFIPVNNFERHYVNRTFAHIANIKTIHIVLVYDEEELTNLVDDAVTIAEIRNFKSRGYEVALELNDNDLTLTSALYDSFDYFIVDVNSNLRVGGKSLQRSLFNFRGLVEKLLKYHRPIIAADIPTWDTVELIDKLGITLVSSEAVSPSSENVLPISPKSTIKIKSIKK